MDIPPRLHGKRHPTSRTVWQVGELVANAPKHYGLTTSPHPSTKSLPETTAESHHRQSSSLTNAEEGDLDRAEALKTKLEEAQRRRRKATEEKGEAGAEVVRQDRRRR
jgi:hypothetical protein